MKWSMNEIYRFQQLWRELKNLDYREVNKRAQFPFQIVLWGSHEELEEMENWLFEFQPQGRAWLNQKGVEDDPRFQKSWGQSRYQKISSDEPIEQLKERLAKATLILSPRNAPADVGARFYHWDSCRPGLEKVLLKDFPELIFAFSYYFPRFKLAHAQKEIRSTALQNTTWAVSSAIPNIIPGPHQLMSAPLEGASDFLVMTANEIKLMFELTAVSGQKVELFKSLGQLGIVLGMAKLAQISATQLVSKIPAGGGVIAKGGVAYAFSTAIGEALFYYVCTGQRMGKEFFQQRIPDLVDEGREWARKKLGKK